MYICSALGREGWPEREREKERKKEKDRDTSKKNVFFPCVQFLCATLVTPVVEMWEGKEANNIVESWSNHILGHTGKYSKRGPGSQ